MTATRSMFLPHIVATDAPAGGWVPYGVGVAATAVLGAWQYYLAQRGKRQDRKQKDEDERDEDDATVQVERIRSRDKFEENRSKEYADLRGEMIRNNEAATLRHNILESRVSTLTSAYHQLHSLTILLQQSWRTMKSRLKRTDPNFDPDEFPDLDMTHLSPREVLAEINRPVSITVVSSPSDPSKMTSIITTGTPPDHKA